MPCALKRIEREENESHERVMKCPRFAYPRQLSCKMLYDTVQQPIHFLLLLDVGKSKQNTNKEKEGKKKGKNSCRYCNAK